MRGELWSGTFLDTLGLFRERERVSGDALREGGAGMHRLGLQEIQPTTPPSTK